MIDYVIRLVLLLPVIGSLAWASLWLWKRVQLGLPHNGRQSRAASIVDVLPLGVAGKLTVVDFGGKRLLVATSRHGIRLLAETSPGRSGE